MLTGVFITFPIRTGPGELLWPTSVLAKEQQDVALPTPLCAESAAPGTRCHQEEPRPEDTRYRHAVIPPPSLVLNWKGAKVHDDRN